MIRLVTKSNRENTTSPARSISLTSSIVITPATLPLLPALKQTQKAIPIVMQLVLNFPQKMLAKELAALAVNLSLNPRNAQMMASQRGLPHLVDRVTETKDPLLMKARR